MGKYKIKLASGSPRRRELLRMLDIDFEVAELVDVAEEIPAGVAAEEIPLYLAGLKADAYRERIGADELYITADTVVIVDGEIIGKPVDEEDACRMLGRLAGRVHKVVTGLCVFTRDRRESASVETLVEMGLLTAEEIRYYVERYKPLDKAGAYGIQEWIGAVAVKSINGSFYNVMGLPVHVLNRMLGRFGA